VVRAPEALPLELIEEEADRWRSARIRRLWLSFEAAGCFPALQRRRVVLVIRVLTPSRYRRSTTRGWAGKDERKANRN